MPWHELDAKLDEAEYFLSEMVRCNDEHRLVKFTLSAFLSASRSVLQYSNEQAIAKGAEGQTWYDQQVTGHPVVKFFRDERDVNIHSESVKPGQVLALEDSLRTSYRLNRWTGNEDVQTLARLYLSELRRIVADGRARGLLT